MAQGHRGDRDVPAGTAGLPGGVWALGLVSLLMDMSSEMTHSLLPVFLVSGLGASALSVGLVEGIAEVTASLVKMGSGMLSDRFGRRKPLTLAGYGLAALSKPLFPLADSVLLVLTARFVDRIGKGIRGAPRDALVADLVPARLRGAAFGLRQALDTVGAVLGPLIAMLVMLLSGGDIRLVFWIAVLPAAVAVLVLALGVREPPPGQPTRPPQPTQPTSAAPPARPAFSLAGLAGLGRPFWVLMVMATVMTLARFSEAFLILRAQDQGLDTGLAPLVLVVMNLTYAATAWPAGVLSDRWGRRGLLVSGVILLVGADLALASGWGVGAALVGAGLWGLHLGMTQGLLSAMVADAAPADRRGTAFGAFNLVTGLGLLVASVLAGALWSVAGPAATFLAGAIFAVVAAIGLITHRPGGAGHG